MNPHGLRADQVRRATSLRTAGVDIPGIAAVLGVDERAVAAAVPSERVEVWPPPVTDDSTYVKVTIRDADVTSRRARVRARSVLLWGETVAINEHGDAYCASCLRFVPVAELSGPRNHHTVGRRNGALTPVVTTVFE